MKRDRGFRARGPKATRARRRQTSALPAGSRIVVKLGGELLEAPGRSSAASPAASPDWRAGSLLVVVHGGGREIDSALATAGIPKQQVDGLRVTDARTLDVVVSVLAGAINTRLVAALRGAGASPVGLTGADASVVDGPPRRAHLQRRGREGRPGAGGIAHRQRRAAAADGSAVARLPARRGLRRRNPSAASSQRERRHARVASRGPLGRPAARHCGRHGRRSRRRRPTIERLSRDGRPRESFGMGTANKGMVAKLEACRAALRKGVGDVLIANGREIPLDEAGRSPRTAARMHTGGSMTVTLDDIRAREVAPRTADLQAAASGVRPRSGTRLFDTEGREYLDFISGIGVTSLGHAHPGLDSRDRRAGATLLHTSNLYYHPFQAEAAARLAQLSGLSRAFFCNSGTEAVEACLKFARRYWYTQGAKPTHGVRRARRRICRSNVRVAVGDA